MVRGWVVTGGMVALSVAGLAACGASSSSSKRTAPTTRRAFVAADAGFSAEFPGTPKRQEQPVEQAGVSLKVLFYQSATNDEVVAVGSSTTPVALTGDGLTAALDKAIDGSAANVHGTVSSRSKTTFLGVPAEDGIISAQGNVVRERVFVVGQRLYIAEGITSGVDKPHVAYDRLLASFKAL
jgi:hypothetical protein